MGRKRDYTCQFCGTVCTHKNLKVHVETAHQETLRKNTLLLMGLTEEDLPKCKFCGKPVRVDFEIYDICGEVMCRRKRAAEYRSDIVSPPVYPEGLASDKKAIIRESISVSTAEAKIRSNGATVHNTKMVKEGRCSFQAANLKRDENGGSISHKLGHAKAVANGKFNLLHNNRLDENGKDRYIAKSIASGKNSLLKQNRPKTIWGTDAYSTASRLADLGKEIHDYEHIKDKQFILNMFVKNGLFDFRGLLEYFNISTTYGYVLKKELGIFIPNLEKHQVQTEVFEFVQSCINNPTIEIRQDDRYTIAPSELDIYVPSKGIAIEYDGLYWHSDELKAKDYHLRKTEACEAKGIKLFHIFENEWIDPVKNSIWKSMIRNALGLSQRIPARKCELVRNPPNLKEFLDKNHMQGYVTSSDKYGLIYDGELVSVMTFGKPRYNKDSDYELLRFCNKRGIHVIGAASKLLKHFKSDHPGKTIVSFANRRWSNGNLYEKLGFRKIHTTEPNYFYFNHNMEVLSRISCQKHKLKNLLGDGFDENLSEKENMLKNGYHIIYDVGNIKYIC